MPEAAITADTTDTTDWKFFFTLTAVMWIPFFSR
jgi:hypothetical protein